MNAIVAYQPFGPRRQLRFTARRRTLHAEDVLRFLLQLPSGERPCVVVLDNVGLHVSRFVGEGIRRARHRRIVLFFLPAYSPELNMVEPVFGVVKAYGMPERAYESSAALLRAVRRAFWRYQHQLLVQQHLWPGA